LSIGSYSLIVGVGNDEVLNSTDISNVPSYLFDNSNTIGHGQYIR